MLPGPISPVNKQIPHSLPIFPSCLPWKCLEDFQDRTPSVGKSGRTGMVQTETVAWVRRANEFAANLKKWTQLSLNQGVVIQKVAGHLAVLLPAHRYCSLPP
jgi:hypothetical protein